MAAVVWIVEGTWPACVDAARRFVPEDTEIVLLHVTSEDAAGVAHGAYAGLMGRAEPGHDPGSEVEQLAAAAAQSLLEAAAARLGRPCRVERKVGRVERVVIAAAQDADLLVVARDEERRGEGAKSLGHDGRYVVDHVPCAVLLVWPEVADRE
jgi:nucleotide-binding universal stress UspA family protein